MTELIRWRVFLLGEICLWTHGSFLPFCITSISILLRGRSGVVVEANVADLLLLLLYTEGDVLGRETLI